MLLKELSHVLKTLGCRPPLGVLLGMIDTGDSDRNGKVKLFHVPE